MAVLNRVQLMGHIGQEPKISTTKDGSSFVIASLATNESYKRNGQWETVTEWHNLVIFGKLASQAERLQKGSQVLVEGKLRSNHWTDKDGVKRQTMSIVVFAMQLIDNIKPKELPEENIKSTPAEYLSQIHALLREGDVPF